MSTGSAAHLPSLPQLPVQHCAGAEQLSPTETQEPLAQVPPTHLRLQHSAPSEHISVGALQKVDEVHLPIVAGATGAAQVVEQQLPSDAQSSPPALQVSVHLPPVQLPEQQSLMVEHASVAATQAPTGSTHVPFAHAFVQQSEFEVQ